MALNIRACLTSTIEIAENIDAEFFIRRLRVNGCEAVEAAGMKIQFIAAYSLAETNPLHKS